MIQSCIFLKLTGKDKKLFFLFIGQTSLAFILLYFYEIKCLAIFKNINKIRMRQKIIQLLSFKPISKLAFPTLYNNKKIL